MRKMAKIYCGKGKRETNTWFKATINPDKIMEYIQEYKGHKFVKININLLDEPDKYGKDVEITVDDWKPESKETPPDVEDTDTSLPF